MSLVKPTSPHKSSDHDSAAPAQSLENHGNEEQLRAALHEVSNALTVVMGWLGELRSRLEPGELRDGIEVARRHARLGFGIARQAIGAPVASARQVQNAGALLEDVVRGASFEAARHGVKLVLHNLDEDALVQDAEAVLQILMNLLLNAFAFSPVGSTVTLAAVCRDGQIEFRVTDQGPGVPAALRSKIFDGGVSTRPGGAGVGLAHCHRLAASLGGELRLVNSGSGACFELVWPLGEARSMTLQRVVRPALIDGMRVLVLEDDAAVVALLELGLEAQGVALATLGDLAALPGQLESDSNFDAALVDLSPLGSDPAGALMLLKSRGIPVILMSGDSTACALDSVASSWVRKPFELSEVCDALRRVREASRDD